MSALMLGSPMFTVASQILASSSSQDSGDGQQIFLLLLAAGPLFAMWVYRRYRNTDKRHHHESETRSTMLDVRTNDQMTGSRKGLRSARMRGANSRRK